MTAIVGFLCQDGVVIGADGMLTPNLGGAPVGHHKGKKLHNILGSFLVAYAGDQGMAARFRYVVEQPGTEFAASEHPMEFVLRLSRAFSLQLKATMAESTGLETMLAFGCDKGQTLCVFDNDAQPIVLDNDSFYAALGVAKTAADPFLRFLVDIFCPEGPPRSNEAVFMTLWTLQHVIDAGPGGVVEPISIGVVEQLEGRWAARIVTPDELQEHKEAVESATAALRKWRHGKGRDSETQVASAPPVPQA